MTLFLRPSNQSLLITRLPLVIAAGQTGTIANLIRGAFMLVVNPHSNEIQRSSLLR